MADLASVFNRRATIAKFAPPAAPRSMKMDVSSSDDDEMPTGTSFDDEFSVAVGEAIGLRYVDANGAVSQRRITVHSVGRSGTGSLFINAWCHERRAARRFRADRVDSIIELATGEIIDHPDRVIERFATLCDEAAPVDNAVDQVMRLARDGLNILVFLARCDGQFHSSESDVISHYLLDVAFDINFDGDAVMVTVGRMHPDPYCYRQSVARLGRGPGDLERVAKFAARLIDADGAISDEEFEFGQELSTALRR